MKEEKFVFILIIASYILFSIVINFQIIPALIGRSEILMIPENTPVYLDDYFKIMIGTYTWNEFLSRRSRGLDFLSYRFFFWLIGSVFNANTTQLLVLEKILIQFLAFFGAFLLTKDYLTRFSKNKETKLVLIASYIAGLVYGVNPSFMVGDSFWMGIQFSFVTLPWIIWSFTKLILDKNWKYAFLCAFLMGLNISEHFLWAGFPIILAFFSGFILIKKLFRKKKIDFHPIFSYFLVILIFLSMTSYRLYFRFSTTSPYQLSSTKLAVDVCWIQASLPNMLRAMSHMELPNIYITTYPLFSFLNSLMPLTLLIPIFAFTSLLWYKRNWIVLFYGTIIIVSALPFFIGSPFKWLHYWLFFNTPFGPAFRTWRVPDATIALSLSVMIAFSVYHILEKLSSKRKHLTVLVVVSMIFVSSIYSWPLLTGDVNSRLTPVKVPDEYFKAHEFLSNRSGEFKVIYIPEFVYSYGEKSNLKPFWNPEWGAIQEFLTFSSPKPTFWPIGSWGHYCAFTLSPFYHSLLRAGNINALAWFLNLANVQYIVVHNDIPTLKENTEKYVNYLNESTVFIQVFNDGFIYIFENQYTASEIEILPEIMLVNGGYRVAHNFYNALNNSDPNYGLIFIDQKVPLDLLEETKIILTDKTNEQLMVDLIFNNMLYENNNYVIYPYDYVIEHDRLNKWSRASYLDPHQQVWHPYINWRDYSWDFDYMKGLTFTDGSNDSIRIPVNLESSGEYVFLLRFFANEKGGEVIINIENMTFEIRTLDYYNGFLWYKNSIYLDDGQRSIIIKNGNGFNALSALSLIPKQEYEKLLENVTDYVSSRQVINLAPYLIENPSFEDALNNWKMDDAVVMDDKFKMLLDDSVNFSGDYSLKVFTNHTKPQYGWSWIRGNWINVKAAEEYWLITHVKAENVNASHIVLVAYDEPNKKVFQLVQAPSAQYDIFDWSIYKRKFTVPENVTKIRVDLNAGWSNQNGTMAITWFDDIKLIPVKSGYISLNLPTFEKNDRIISWIKIDPTKYVVKVNATKPFMLSFAEAYDPLWTARVNDQKTSSIPLYSVINGFWIEETGLIDVTIEYEPQRWFYIGSAISVTTLISCAIYLTYDWTKNKAILKRVKKWSRSDSS
jgi:hypothetical protein